MYSSTQLTNHLNICVLRSCFLLLIILRELCFCWFDWFLNDILIPSINIHNTKHNTTQNAHSTTTPALLAYTLMKTKRRKPDSAFRKFRSTKKRWSNGSPSTKLRKSRFSQNSGQPDIFLISKTPQMKQIWDQKVQWPIKSQRNSYVKPQNQQDLTPTHSKTNKKA